MSSGTRSLPPLHAEGLSHTTAFLDLLEMAALVFVLAGTLMGKGSDLCWEFKEHLLKSSFLCDFNASEILFSVLVCLMQ